MKSPGIKFSGAQRQLLYKKHTMSFFPCLSGKRAQLFQHEFVKPRLRCHGHAQGIKRQSQILAFEFDQILLRGNESLGSALFVLSAEKIKLRPLVGTMVAKNLEPIGFQARQAGFARPQKPKKGRGPETSGV